MELPLSSHPELIDVASEDGHAFSAYIAGPVDAAHGVVVVQEIFGVNHYIRSVCDSLAEKGYRVIAPALFDRITRNFEVGYSAEEARAGMEIRQRLDETLALRDVSAAAMQLPTPSRGIVGFCMGGTISWRSASRTSLFRAAVGWYGTGIAADVQARLNCPVQLHFGETDHAIPLADALAVRDARPDVEVFIYPAGHGFGCTERKSYHAPSADLAWKRTYAFLEAHLKKSSQEHGFPSASH
jgi:carboxymethylenebutenolidase